MHFSILIQERDRLCHREFDLTFTEFVCKPIAACVATTFVAESLIPQVYSWYAHPAGSISVDDGRRMAIKLYVCDMDPERLYEHITSTCDDTIWYRQMRTRIHHSTREPRCWDRLTGAFANPGFVIAGF